MKIEFRSGVVMYPDRAVRTKLAVALVVHTRPSEGGGAALLGIGASIAAARTPVAASGSHQARRSRRARPRDLLPPRGGGGPPGPGRGGDATSVTFILTSSMSLLAPALT